jgi:hypothetical protein
VLSFWLSLAILALMLALDAAWWVAVLRLTRRRRWRVLMSLFMAAQIAALLSVLGGHDWLNRAPKAVIVASVLWHHLALFLVAAILLPLGLLRLYAWLVRFRMRWTGIGAGKVRKPPGAEPASIPKPNALSRREFLGAATALAPAVFTVGLTGMALPQLNQFRVRRFELPLPALPRDLDGVTIAHVSDIHVGPFTNGRVLRDLVSTTNALHADLVLITGDLINYELADLSEGLALVKAMPGRYGQWMIEGNHDLFDDPAEFERRVRASGVPFLRDESAVTLVRGRPVQFHGLGWQDDNSAAGVRQSARLLRTLMKQGHPEAFPILLAHHPHAFDAAVAADLPLTLSGHTHGGYLMLDPRHGVGPVLFRYWSGHYQRGHSHLIVSNGVGNGFPLRLNAPAEIIHLTLRRAVG